MGSIKFLIILVTLAILLRLPFLTNQDLYMDEAIGTVVTKLFLEQDKSAWALNMAQPPPMMFWINSVSMSFFGFNDFSLRFTSVVFGIATVILVFYLTNFLYGKKAAVFASLILAVLPIHVMYSRFAFGDVIIAFFSVAAIFASEYSRKFSRNGQALFLILSGILFAAGFLVKFNILIVWGLYWLFVLLSNLRGQFKKEVYRFLVSNLFAIAVIIASTGFDISNLFYLVYGFVYLMVKQTTGSADPGYFLFLALFDLLSPLLYLCFLFSIIYIFRRNLKTKNRSDILLLFLIISFFILALMQKRTSVRHLVLISPFIAMLVGRFFSKLKSPASSVALIVILSATGWSMLEVSKEINFTLWSDAGSYIDENFDKGAAVHLDYPYWPIGFRLANSSLVPYYTKREVKIQLQLDDLKMGDIFIISNFENRNLLIRQEPMKNTLALFRVKQETPKPVLQSFVKSHSRLVKTFYCGNQECIYLYRLDYISDEEKEKYAPFIEHEDYTLFKDQARKRFLFNACLFIRQPGLISLFDRDLIRNINRSCGF